MGMDGSFFSLAIADQVTPVVDAKSIKAVVAAAIRKINREEGNFI
jgi:hypothetical protein